MKIIVCAFISLILVSCNNDNKDIYIDESLMSYKPYATLSDSLQENPLPERYFRRGLLSYKLKSYRSAHKDYTSAFIAKPCPEYAEAIVSSLYALQKFDSVEQFVEDQKKYFVVARYHEIMSLAMENTGRYQEALTHTDELIKNDTSNYYLVFQKANLLINLGDTANAILNYEKCLQQLNEFPDVKFALGDLYSEMGNSRTLDICNLMMKDTANFHAEPYFLQGVYYSKTLQPAKAYESFNQAIGKDWKYIAAYIQKGIVKYNNKDYDAALKIFEVALVVSNTDADVYYWIGRCKEAQNKKAEAIDYYKKTLGLDERYDEAAEALKRLDAR